MRIHPSRRLGVLGAFGVGLAGFGLLVGVGLAVTDSDKPDLVPLLPTNHSNKNDRWLDTSEPSAPGRTLYRFDTVIENVGSGAWAVFRNNASSPTYQFIYSGGNPPAVVEEGTPNPVDGGGGTAFKVGDANTPNAISYSPWSGHNHFHTKLVAAYQLLTTGHNPVATAAKNAAGFCLYDSWPISPTVDYFPDSLSCHPDSPNYSGAIQIGLSAGWGDFYSSQLSDQWVDVTDVSPGDYILKATVNPNGLYQEKTAANNSIEAPVTIAGVIAAGGTGSTTPGKSVDVPISGTVVGANERSRKPGCSQTSDPACLTTNPAPGKLSFQSLSPGVTIVDTNPGDLKATARFTPPAGSTGVKTFTFTATDARGLVSKPATVTVTVTAGGSTAGTGGGGGGTPPGTTGTPNTAKATVTLKPAFRLVRSGGRTFLKVSGALPTSQSGRLVRVQRRVGKRITTIAGIRVAKTGRYAKLIRVSTNSLSVRTALGSSATTKAALSGFRRISF